jgi:hypothetical protein
MNAVINSILAAIVFYSSHVALEKLHSHVKQTTLVQVHQGLPSLTSFANRLTSKPEKRKRVLRKDQCPKEHVDCLR